MKTKIVFFLQKLTMSQKNAERRKLTEIHVSCPLDVYQFNTDDIICKKSSEIN